MLNIKRNQVIITALIVMIAVAGYLNYIDVKEADQQAAVMLTEEDEFNPMALDDLGRAVVSEDELTNDRVIQGDDAQIAFGDLTSTLEQTEITETAQNEESQQEEDSALYVYNEEGEVSDDYFVQAKLLREQDRSKQKNIITELINNKNVTTEEKTKYAEEILNLQKRIEKESAAEELLKAKGFKDVYVRLSDESADVVIGNSVLTDAQVAQIEDIVTRKTGMNPKQIKIIPMQKK
jgi:stage III sporulation protein AH